MKKILLLLLSAAVAVSAAAGVNPPSKRVLQDKSRGIPLVDKNVNKDVKGKRKAVDDRMMAPPMRQSFNATDDGRPEGHLKRYTRSGKAVILTDGTYQSFNQSDTMDIVYGLDGTTVYLKNILYGSNVKFGDYWVQGQLSADGTQITVPMGQRIYHSSSPVINVVLAWGRSSYTVHGTSSRFTFEVNEDVTEAVYLIDGNTITLQDSFTTLGSLNPGFEGTGLGCIGRSGTSDPTFAGFFEWETVLTFASFTPNLITEIPESCTVHKYKRNSTSIYQAWYIDSPIVDLTDGIFKVAFDRDNQPDVYIQNPMWALDVMNTWVKGSYNRFTKIITIPTGQYLNWSEQYQYGEVLGWGNTYFYQDSVDDEGNPHYDMGHEVSQSVKEIRMKVDGDNLYLLGTQGDYYADFPDNYVATGMMAYWSDYFDFSALEFSNHDGSGDDLPWGVRINIAPAVPANPTIDEWRDCGNESGFSRLDFTLPEYDVDGKPLDPELLSYSIVLDDNQLFTFDAATYGYNLTEDLTEIPYSIWGSDYYDFHPSYVYFYRTNAEGYEPFFNWRIGIQAHYTVDGVKYSSGIEYLEVFDNPNSMLGDVNMDNQVSIGDVTALIDYLLNEDSTGISLSNADINQDQDVSIADVTALIDMLLAGN